MLLAVVPGYIAISCWTYGKSWRRPTGDLQAILQSIVISVVIQVVASPFTLVWLGSDPSKWLKDPWLLSVWAGALLLGSTLGAYVVGQLSEWVFSLQGRPNWWPNVRPPTVWDWLFTRPRPDPFFIVVEFTDGRLLAGTFEEGSQALTSPLSQGMFLNRQWEVGPQGTLLGPVPGTQGILITNVESIRSLRIIRST